MARATRLADDYANATRPQSSAVLPIPGVCALGAALTFSLYVSLAFLSLRSPTLFVLRILLRAAPSLLLSMGAAQSARGRTQAWSYAAPFALVGFIDTLLETWGRTPPSYAGPHAGGSSAGPPVAWLVAITVLACSTLAASFAEATGLLGSAPPSQKAGRSNPRSRAFARVAALTLSWAAFAWAASPAAPSILLRFAALGVASVLLSLGYARAVDAAAVGR